MGAKKRVMPPPAPGLVPTAARRSFYQQVRGSVLREYFYGRLGVPSRNDADHGWSALMQTVNRCSLIAMTELDLRGDTASCRSWLAEAAAVYTDLVERLGSAETVSSLEAMRTLFRIGVCHDEALLRRFGLAYLNADSSAEHRPRDERYGWFPLLLGQFFAGRSTRATLTAMRDFEPPKWRTNYREWFSAMRALAVETLDARSPDPLEQLIAVAETNQRMFSRPNADVLYEAWFAELAMAFVPAAIQRGWRVPPDSPHPSLRFELFRLAPLIVGIRPWNQLKRLRPPDALAAEIVERANPGKNEPTFLPG